MPDPIRCAVDPSQPNHTVTCEAVEIGPEPAPVPAAAVTPAPSPQSPAVAALVQRFPGTRHEVHAPVVDTVTLGTAHRCLGELSAFTPLVLGLSGPYFGAAGGFKVGYDIGVCAAKDLQDRQLAADRQAGIEDCESQGGTVVGEVGHTLICERALPEVAP
ncbi:MAG TPA: hypothetical protein VIK01_08475 [Polyangiaceae bacterium]